MTENSIEQVNSTTLIVETTTATLSDVSTAFADFKDFIKNELKDGIDFGQIPNVKIPCLFKAGGEKIQMLLGLTPQYKLLSRAFIPNQSSRRKSFNATTKKYDEIEIIRNYYSWEWACELWKGGVKIAEGVGMANTEEEKYVTQYERHGKSPDGLANTVMKIAKKRAFMDAIIAVSGISDMFTQDLEDNETIKSLKTDKSTKVGKLTRANRKDIFARLGAYEINKAELSEILAELGYASIDDCKAQDCNTILQAINNYAARRKKDV